MIFPHEKSHEAVKQAIENDRPIFPSYRIVNCKTIAKLAIQVNEYIEANQAYSPSGDIIVCPDGSFVQKLVRNDLIKTTY